MKKATLSTILSFFLLVAPAFAETTVDVYGEGQYSDTELNVMLYADISGIDAESLVSAGLSLHFDPTQLQVVAADKDEVVWYLGDPDTGTYAYFNPMEHVNSYVDPTTNQTMTYVPIICGKLDSRTGNALNGVAPGTKIPLGFVTFNYPTGSAMPDVVTGLTIKHAKPEGDGTFKTFVTVGQVVLDDIAGAVGYGVVAMSRDIAVCLGDLNGDMVVNGTDFVLFKGQWGGTGSADFNSDGIVNGTDFVLFKSYWGSSCN